MTKLIDPIHCASLRGAMQRAITEWRNSMTDRPTTPYKTARSERLAALEELQRAWAEAQQELETLRRQLEAQEVLIVVITRQRTEAHDTIEAGNRIIADLSRQLAEARAEIERLRSLTEKEWL
jgi:septal ring factor EnvC (AmiA/AmiB activator)